MVVTGQPAPPGVVDRLLWRDAQSLLGEHVPAAPGACCAGCGRHWPCAPHRLAQRAATAACRRWRDAWTVRHDLNSIRVPAGRPAPARRDGSNRRYDRH